MITNFPMLFSVWRAYGLACITTAGPLILLGIYYGFLTTLPVGPSHLLTIRAFLLEGEGRESEAPGTVAKSGIVVAAISGLTVSQLAFCLSIYWPPLYILWVKPHLLTLLVLPYLLFYWFRIQEFESTGWLKTEHPIYNSRIVTTFLDSFVFQVLNPVLLPSPVMTRLMSLFFFRYSQVYWFILGTAIGWLGGQLTFVLLSWLLLLRLERDLPTIYIIIRRLVHSIFPPIIFGLCLAYLGRNRISFFMTQTGTVQIPELRPIELWPSVAFDTTLWKRPLRLAKKDALDNAQPLYNNKKRFSQYIFAVCAHEGKRRLSHTYPQSLLTFKSHLEDCLDIASLSEQTEETIYNQWTNSKQKRKEKISQIIWNKMKALDNGAPLETVIENKVASWTTAQHPVRKILDPRLSKYMRGNILSTTIESPWIKGQSSLSDSALLEFPLKLHSSNLAQNSHLREWISIKSEQIGNTIILPWQSLEHEASDGLFQLFNQLEEQNPNKTIQYTWETLLHAYKLRPKVDIETTMVPYKKIWYHLQKQSLVKLLTQIFSFGKQPVNTSQVTTLLDYYKPLPIWYAQRHYETTDISKPKARKRLKSFDFRRRLTRGSLGARRRKTLICKAFQIKPETPFLLRTEVSNQEDISIQYTISRTSQDTNLYAVQTARRFNFTWAHLLRGPALVIQSWFRRYIKQPVLIILKNIGRLLLLQKTEWSEDIADWNREVYVNCLYDGTQYSISERPKKWYVTGLQIRILFPFHLKPWHSSTVNKTALLDNHNSYLTSQSDLVKNSSILEDSSYLTVWGSETEVPFGKNKKLPSFWKPTLKAIRIVISRKLNKRIRNIRRIVQPVYKLVQTLFVTNSTIQPISLTQDVTSTEENIQLTFKANNQVDSNGNSISNKYEHKKLSQPVTTTESLPIQTVDNQVGEDSVPISSYDIPSIPRTKLNQNRLIAVATDSEWTHNHLSNETTLFDMKPIVTNNALNEHSLIGRVPMQTKNNAKHIFTVKLVSKESSISMHYKLTQLSSLRVHFQRKCIYLQQNIKIITLELFRRLQIQLRQIYNSIFALIEQLMQILTSQAISVIRTTINGIDQIIDDLSIIKIKRLTTQSSDRFYETTPTNLPTITQAYVLHKIWQTVIDTTPTLTWVKQQWTPENYLKNDFRTQLVNQGILNCKEPNQITQANWNKWLECFPQYTPASNLWSNIVPNLYRSKVGLYWKYSDNLNSQQQGENMPIHFSHIEHGSGLKYHYPLFQKVQKMFKRWKVYNLYRRYTGLVHTINVKGFSIEHLEKEIASYHDSNDFIANNVFHETEEITADEPTEWGFKRTRIGRMSPYLPLLQPNGDNSIDEIDTQYVEHLGLLSSLESYTQLNTKTNVTSSSSKTQLDKNTTSASTQMDTVSDSQLVSANLTQRTCFEPMYVSKFKSKIFKERCKHLLNAARLSLLATTSGITTDTISSLSSDMQKALSILTDDLNTHTDVNEDVLTNQDMKQDAYSKQMRNSVLFKQNPQNWRLKIIDDQILMYNVISPILRLSNRQHNQYILNLCQYLLGELSLNSFNSIIALTPEDLLRPVSSRELRVLECLDFTAEPNDYRSTPQNMSLQHIINSINLDNSVANNTTQLSDSNSISQIDPNFKTSYVIRRFLWPASRLEDLACMNRFWIGIGNQSRFSALRISMYP